MKIIGEEFSIISWKKLEPHFRKYGGLDCYFLIFTLQFLCFQHQPHEMLQLNSYLWRAHDEGVSVTV